MILECSFIAELLTRALDSKFCFILNEKEESHTCVSMSAIRNEKEDGQNIEEVKEIQLKYYG